MQAQHGDAVRLRLGPWHSWLLFHPHAVEAVLATHATSFVRFEPVMRVLAQWNGESLLVSEGERWHSRRRKVLPAFATRRMPGYAERIVERTVALRDEWEAAEALVIDTDREMVALTLEIAADTLFGEALGARAQAIGQAVAVLSDVAFRESTSPLVLPDWMPLRSKARKRRAIADMDTLVRGIVATPGWHCRRATVAICDATAAALARTGGLASGPGGKVLAATQGRVAATLATAFKPCLMSRPHR